MTTGVPDTQTEMARVQFELNLQITELQLRAQPSNPLELNEERVIDVTEAVVMVDSVVEDST